LLLKQRRYRRLAWLLVLIGVMNLLDFMATQDLVVVGEHGEWNPLMRPLVGTPYFILHKLALVPLGLLFLWTVRGILVPKYMVLIFLTCGLYLLVVVYTWVVFYAT
jgi:hypothetical protein